VQTLSAPPASDRHRVLMRALDQGIALTRAHMGNIQRFDPSTGTLRIEVQRGFGGRFLEFFDEVRGEASVCGAAFESARTVVVEDVAESPIFLGSPALEVMLDAQARAVVSVPLVASSGRVLGILSTHVRRPRRLCQAEIHLVEALAHELAGWLEQDPLHGLPTPP
jgi:GAF domain-containing protein